MIALLLAVSVAFPGAGAKLPHLERCYMSGACERGVTNLTVQGRAVDVYRTGGWVTMLDLVPGTNTIELVAGGVATNHVFFVEPPPQPLPPRVDADGNPLPPPKPRVYEKLDYAADSPRPHPRSDTGTLSPHAFPEKDANLRVAREVRKALEAKGYRVKMTRDSDVALVLTERARAAHAEGADAFVSIHHNAPGFGSDPRTVRYHTVYSWNPLGAALAQAINARMAEALDGDIPSKGPLHANFAVTRSPEVPSVLIEVDFITTPEGEEACWNVARRRFIGRAIADGIADWCVSEVPPRP